MGLLKNIKNKKDNIRFETNGFTIKNLSSEDISNISKMVEPIDENEKEVKVQLVEVYKYVIKNLSNEPDELDGMSDEEILELFNSEEEDIAKINMEINNIIQYVTYVSIQSSISKLKMLEQLMQKDEIKQEFELIDKIVKDKKLVKQVEKDTKNIEKKNKKNK